LHKRHALRNLLPLLVLVEKFLALFPSLGDFLGPYRTPGRDFGIERKRSHSQTLGQVVCHGRLLRLPKVKGPQHACDAEEHGSVGDVHARADAAAGSESKMVTATGVYASCRLAG